MPSYINEEKTLNIDDAIKVLLSIKDKYGGDIPLMMSYDGSAGYDCIRSIYPENFHNQLIISLSCIEIEEAINYKTSLDDSKFFTKNI